MIKKYPVAHVYIDVQNLKQAIRSEGKKVDFKKLMWYLKTYKYATKIYYFVCELSDMYHQQEYVTMQEIGYSLELKKVEVIKKDMLDIYTVSGKTNVSNLLHTVKYYFDTKEQTGNDLIQRLHDIGMNVQQDIYTHSSHYKPLIKGNIDIDLTVKAMSEVNDIDTFILISGDGDFRALCDFMLEKGKKLIILAPREDRCSRLLKQLKSKGSIEYIHTKADIVFQESKNPSKNTEILSAGESSF